MFGRKKISVQSGYKLAFIAFAIAGLAGCETLDRIQQGEFYDKPLYATDRVLKQLNSDPKAKNMWSIEKQYTEKESYSIFKGPDNKLYAIDLKNFDSNKSFTSQISSGAIVNVVYNGYNAPLGYNEKYPYGRYIDLQTGISFEAGSLSSKDLESIGADFNEEEIASVRIGLVSEFGLSEARAEELATMASSLGAVLKNQNRALTERDLNSLQVKAMGFTVADLARAKINGDTKAIEKMTVKAAQLNRISPEQAKRLINQMSN